MQICRRSVCPSGLPVEQLPPAVVVLAARDSSGQSRSEVEHRFWYQYYFHGERGREGLTRNRSDLCRLLWRLWSPTWNFDDATFRATSSSFDNDDFVDVVIHSYRHRFLLAEGDSDYDDIERLLSAQPQISVPSVVLVGADDGVDPPGDDLRVELGLDQFTDLVEVRVLPGCGHNPPQEVPDLFEQAMHLVL
jgi:pimeloyl-ACP methyl ester carboxylesterase